MTTDIDYDKALGECKNLFGDDLKCQETSQACSKACGMQQDKTYTDEEKAAFQPCFDACDAQLNKCIEDGQQHMDSCVGNLICQIFNEAYGGGMYTEECGEYSPIVSKLITYPIVHWVLTGLYSLIPDSLKAGAIINEANLAAYGVWPTYKEQWDLVVSGLEAAWAAARKKAGLSPRTFCLEAELVDAISANQHRRGGVRLASPQIQQGLTGIGPMRSTAYCAPGRLNAAEAITRWCATDTQHGGWGKTVAQHLSVEGETSGVGSLGLEASTYPDGPVEALVESGPFNLRFTNWRRFKDDNEGARNALIYCIASVWSARMASVERAMVPLQAAIVAQVVADKHDQAGSGSSSGSGPGVGTVLAVGAVAGGGFLAWKYWDTISIALGLASRR